MSTRPTSNSVSVPLSLRQEMLVHSGVSTALAMAVLNATTLTSQAVTPEATPAPRPAKGKVRDPQAIPPLQAVIVTEEGDSYQPERAASPKYPEPLLNTPQTISIIPNQVIQDQNATNLRDIVRNVPGITIQAGEGGATPGDNFVIRGFSARTDVYIDGVRDLNGFFRDPFNIEQVEITKGPASVYRGRGSTGGNINIVTKTPGITPFFNATGSIGTDEFYRGTIDLNQPVRFGWGDQPEGKNVAPAEEATSALRFNAVWHNSDVPGRDEATFQRWGIAPSVAFGLGTPTQLTVSYLHLDQNNMPDFGIPWVTATNNALRSDRNQPAPVDFSNYYGLNQRDHEKLRTDELTAIFTHSFSESLNLRYIFHYARNSRDSVISAPRFISDDSSLINREFQSRDEIDSALTNEIDLTWKVATFGVEHTITAGFEYTHETFQNRLRNDIGAPLADLFNPDVDDYFPGPVSRTGVVNETDTDTAALYLFDTIKLGEQWQISGGVRGDYFDADNDAPVEDVGIVAYHRTDKFLSWRGALLYKPVPIGTVYFGYGNSYNPSAEGLTLNDATRQLKPEKTSTFELGTKWDVLEQRLSLNAALFYTRKENTRTPGLVPGDLATVLEGEQQVLGFEIEAKGHLTPEWEVIGGYTYTDSQIKKSNIPDEVGSELPGVPRNSFTLWTTYDLPGNFEIGAGAQYVDQRFANPINTRNAGSYHTFDAMLAYKVNKNLTIRANVYNLTDEEYIGGLHIQGSFGHFIPGPGRFATLTASLQF